MSFLPLAVNLEGKKILLVGGGRVAAQKLRTLLWYTSDITVLAPHILPDLRHHPLTFWERPFSPESLMGFHFVYACTDDRAVNREVGAEARRRGIWVNVADDPAACDFISPALYKRGPMSVAVTSNAQEARRSVTWRNLLRHFLESQPESNLAADPPAPKQGHVALVGFGPGQADLRTFRAERFLAEADVIFYDDLIEDASLEPYKGRKVYVGKRKGGIYSDQAVIIREMLDAARAGQRVVRLKGGDPSIFGRAGEELEGLVSQGFPVTVVPGVTAASAAAAAAGISLTHRDAANRVEFRTAHTAEEARPSRDKSRTIVYYMAASRLPEVRDTLLGEGWPKSTPALLAQDVGGVGQSLIRTTLESVTEHPSASPLLVIVGETAKGHHS